MSSERPVSAVFAEPSAEAAPDRLVEVSADVRAAVLLDAAGGLLASSLSETAHARRLAELTHELVLAADSTSKVPAEQIEAQTGAGAVFAVRSARHTLACVVRRLALPALILYDLHRAMDEIEATA